MDGWTDGIRTKFGILETRFLARSVSDSGARSKKTKITDNDDDDNARPFVVDDRAGEGTNGDWPASRGLAGDTDE